MSISQPAITKPGTAASAWAHVNTADENCPTCDQPIAHARFEEIKETIRARQAEQATHIAARLQEQFSREKAEALEEASRTAATMLADAVVTARAEERSAADAAAAKKLADAERENKETQAVLQTRIEQAEAAKMAAEQFGDALRAELNQTRFDYEAAIQKMKEEAEANVLTIRADAVKKAEVAVQEKIAHMDRARHEAEAALQTRIADVEAAKTAAEQSSNTLRAQLNEIQLDHEAALRKMEEEAEASVLTIRADAVKEAEAAVQEKIAVMERTRHKTETVLQAKIVSAEQAKAAAEAKAVVYQQQVQQMKDAHEADVVQRLNEQREVLEKAQSDAVNAQKSASFQKELKLQDKVDQLQRALDNKTAEELGEGAEIDLFELLKGEFEGDKIERINRGQPGADILHTVVHNGKDCGSIIYDSKNHNAWRSDFVTKLAADQMGVKADHAVLSTRKFPAGTRHLHVHDGVILAAPSRVLAIVHILRQHIVQTHTLRWGNEARAQKTAALYDFINSERCRDLFMRVDTQAEKLLDLQVKEKKAHESNWKTQGELIRSIQKVRAEIINEIDSIIGTAETLEQAVHE